MSGNTPRQPDRRVRKTHEALHAALAGLIVSQGYDRISVQQVLDAADVGRSTFYAHFSGKEALLRSGFERLRHDLATKATTENGPFAFVLPLLDHASHHAGLYAALLNGGGGNIAQTEMRAIVRPLVERDLAAYDIADRRVAAVFLTAGLLAAMEDWLPGTGRDPRPILAALRAAATGLAAG
jgi:AcrR family transcriptional regulator